MSQPAIRQKAPYVRRAKFQYRRGADRRGAPELLEALHEGPLNTLQLAERTGRFPWHVSSLLYQLVKDGVVARVGRAPKSGKTTPPMTWRLTTGEQSPI